MSDVLTKAQRHKCMSRIRGKDTTIEVTLRKRLWDRGIRYLKNAKNLPGKPDIVITKYNIAVFCDSEFWHGKDWLKLRKTLKNSNNSDFWIEKIRKNRARDRKVNKQLVAAGWKVMRFWGADIKKSPEKCVDTICNMIQSRE